MRYSAGALVLDGRESSFPTGVDRRVDLGDPSRIDVYYGMADSRVGAARLDVPTRTMRS